MNTRGLLIAFTRCNDPAREQDWSEWYDDVHLPDLVGHGGPWIATRWQLSEKPAPGRPSIGFSHVAIYEFEGPDLDAQVRRLLARDRELRRDERVHPNHCVIGAEVFRAHEKWCDKPRPSEALRGHILAYVMSNRPEREDEWNEWYDAVHAPDMMASGAFSALTRWVRRHRSVFGAQYITLYDVTRGSVAEAVERSAAVLPRIRAEGRWLSCHTGAMAITLEPSGRYGGAGCEGQAPGPGG